MASEIGSNSYSGPTSSSSGSSGQSGDSGSSSGDSGFSATRSGEAGDWSGDSGSTGHQSGDSGQWSGESGETSTSKTELGDGRLGESSGDSSGKTEQSDSGSGRDGEGESEFSRLAKELADLASSEGSSSDKSGDGSQQRADQNTDSTRPDSGDGKSESRADRSNESSRDFSSELTDQLAQARLAREVSSKTEFETLLASESAHPEQGNDSQAESKETGSDKNDSNSELISQLRELGKTENPYELSSEVATKSEAQDSQSGQETDNRAEAEEMRGQEQDSVKTDGDFDSAMHQAKLEYGQMGPKEFLRELGDGMKEVTGELASNFKEGVSQLKDQLGQWWQGDKSSTEMTPDQIRDQAYKEIGHELDAAVEKQKIEEFFENPEVKAKVLWQVEEWEKFNDLLFNSHKPNQ
jgi:hypothetical protein